MPLTTKPMTDEELEAFEDGRDFHADLLQSIHEMKAGRGTVVHSQAIAARTASGLSQAQFAALLGVSVRTLQEWEQGRRKPTGAAQTLLRVAVSHPEMLRELVAG
ncbi:MAG: helix-turn-helix domain-containing protein [Methylobacter sp.]